jgi:hypothetical protein
MSELICPKCGSHKFEPGHSVTLMGGPINYYTYTCAQCQQNVKVRRVDRSQEPNEVTLGEEDQVVSG